ncbi:Crp/Fnr family transcriptional regulator [Fodinicurvata sp. EGI_FJ10296]|uniref:Crp/Fnr family transcriptional regulator n=1 Tax=Fodinicurvata sp. EGI_FJ10296 TaxID=3231908 RepID=UPI0034529395
MNKNKSEPAGHPPDGPVEGRKPADDREPSASASPTDRGGLETYFAQSRWYRRRSYLCSKESIPKRVYYVRSGICLGFDMMADGRRQVVSIYMAGDFINAEAVFTRRTSLDIMAMEDAEVAAATVADIDVQLTADDGFRMLLTKAIARRNAILEAWVGALGRKSAMERMAMLFCELAWRLKSKGPGDGGQSCSVPFNQHDLADILGISVVHVNRVLRTMRELGLATFDAGQIEILDPVRLSGIAEFDAAYLH